MTTIYFYEIWNIRFFHLFIFFFSYALCAFIVVSLGVYLCCVYWKFAREKKMRVFKPYFKWLINACVWTRVVWCLILCNYYWKYGLLGKRNHKLFLFCCCGQCRIFHLKNYFCVATIESVVSKIPMCPIPIGKWG